MRSQWIKIAIMSGVLTGCADLRIVRPNDPTFAAVPPEKMRPPKPTNGAIYQQGFDLNLFETNRARHVGDILTVKLQEKTDAKKKATTVQTKNSTTTMDNPTTFMGRPFALGSGYSLGMDVNTTGSFDGEGESKQNNSLDGSITVSVSEVLPNGNLVIRGEKWLMINQGNEYIRLTGIIRTYDIDEDDSIRSDKIANARIEYSGTGQVASTNAQGWFSKFLWSPLFPL